MASRIAYLVNQYPKVSHSFIRREILALERQGFEIERIALRGWDGELADAEDVEERRRTRYVLQHGVLPLLFVLVLTALLSPVQFFAATVLTWRMSRGGDRPLAYHLIYLAEACRILPWLKAFGAKHLHAHFGTNSAEVAMLARALGGPSYSFTVHGPEEFDKPQRLKLREKVRNAAFVVAISSYGRSQLFRWVEYDYWPKVRVVHCGLEPAFFELLESRSPELRRLVCVGRLCEQKGQLLLIEALACLREQQVYAELVLAGDGEMRADIERLVERHGLASQVRITGWLDGDSIQQEILAAGAMVLPSFAEGLPVVLMEAMALRRPVLTTYVAGIPELVVEGENGWLVPPGSVKDLAVAMRACLSAPAERLAEMGKAGHRRVRERHSIDTEAAKLGALFRQAAQEAGQSAKRRVVEMA